MPPPDPPPQKDSPPFVKWLRGFVRGYKTDSSLRDALEEYIQATPEEGTADITLHERLMLANVLKIRDLRVVDVMIPRASIVGVEANATRDDLLHLLADKQYSRLPVYRRTLDDVIGTLHIKDILAHLARNEDFTIQNLVRPVPVVSPTLPISDLIMQMRENRKHMVMVVDEHSGIDGLVTIGDVIETIFGEISDEYDVSADDMVTIRPDGTLLVDTRLTLEDFERRFGSFFTNDEREENDTINGLVFSLAGHVPARGEIIRHPSTPLKFEVIDSDARRVYRVRVKNLSLPPPQI
jgi:CBS domain containing-hemolysin-like protein